MSPNEMAVLYRNQSWMYSLLKDEAAGLHYLEVVCGTAFLYSVYLRLSDDEVATFLADVDAGFADNMTALAKQVMYHGGQGIEGREYLRPE